MTKTLTLNLDRWILDFCPLCYLETRFKQQHPVWFAYSERRGERGVLICLDSPLTL